MKLQLIFYTAIFISYVIYAQNMNTYNYYELAVQKWCGANHSYQIHGLWPQYTNTTYPEYCNNVSFDSNIPKNLLSKMNNDWNNCNDSLDLWKHEWTKHGTCFNEQTSLNQTVFFETTINLFEFVKNDSNICQNKTECIIGCFDLNYNQIDCSTKHRLTY